MMTEAADNIISGDEKLFAPVEVAEIFGLKQSTIQEMCRNGRIKASKIGTQWRIAESEVRRYLCDGPLDQGGIKDAH